MKAPDEPSIVKGEKMFKKACLEFFGRVRPVRPERSRRKGRSCFDERSVYFVRERERREERQICEPEGGKTATPGLASRSGKARERRWRPSDQTQDRLFSTFPSNKL